MMESATEQKGPSTSTVADIKKERWADCSEDEDGDRPDAKDDPEGNEWQAVSRKRKGRGVSTKPSVSLMSRSRK